jgi:Formyl transferase
VLEVSGRGFLNLHPAYLPFDRGWHTASWAILEGAAGATLHFMDKGLDTGDIILQKQLPVAEDDTADTLYRKLKLLEPEVFRAAWPQIQCGAPTRIPQNPDAGTLHLRKDLFQPQLQEMDLEQPTTAREVLARLRALTTDRLDEAAYFRTNGTRHRVRIEITSETARAPINESSGRANYQRSLVLQRLVFDRMLSADLEEALHKPSLACAENHKKVTGLIEFFGGLYLHFQEAMTQHFRGDFGGFLDGNLPKHRCGRLGLVPEGILDRATSDDDSAEAAYIYNLRLSDDVIRLLWLSARLANAVGKKPSLKDVIAVRSEGALNKRDIILAARLAPTIDPILFSKRCDPYDFASGSVSVTLQRWQCSSGKHISIRYH